MQKWEYCAVVGITKKNRDPGAYYPAIWYFTDEGIMIANIQGQEIKEVGRAIAWLGNEGWEMVGAATIPEQVRLNALDGAVFFKRQKN